MSTTSGAPLPRSVVALNLSLGALAVVATAAGWSSTSTVNPAWALVYVPLVLLAEYLVIRIRFRSRRDYHAVNLVDAVLAPLILAFSTPVVVGVVVSAQVAAAYRRNDPVRGWFNTSQWALAAACGSLTFHALADGSGVNGRDVAALAISLAVVGSVNQAAFAVVVTLAQRRPLRRVMAALGPARGWLLGWLVNGCFGILFATALEAGPAVAFLFVVPLLALHAAYREYASAASARSRLERVHAAARALAQPVDPSRALPLFMTEVARCYQTAAVDLVLVEPGGPVLHRHRGETAPPRPLDGDAEPLVAALLREGRTTQLSGPPRATVDRLRVEAGWAEVMASPLTDGDELIGILVVYNPSGLEGDRRDEFALLDSLTREAAAIVQKGRVVQTTLEERALLARVVANASDGILTVAADGTTRSWNPGLARITGWSDAEMIGKRSLANLRPCDPEGMPVDFERWTVGQPLPTEIQITARDGRARTLECSYGHITAREHGDDILVVVARDVTESREVARLQEEVGRLEKLERTQRAVVNQLQDAVRPERPSVDGAQMAVEYIPADPSAPSGGDLYDWQLLPDGDLHLAVVDVLGHGVGATKSAVTVTHVLRTLAMEGCPLDQLMQRAERVLAAQASSLVATALVARYRPATGELRLVGAGHPPALVVRGDGTVEQVAAGGIPLGWPGAGADQITRATLDHGDLIVLYTDGLIEATRDIIAGLRALEATAAEMRELPVDDLVVQLVARSLAGGQRRDDSLALVLRRATPAPASFEHVMVTDPHAVRQVRHALNAWLVEHGCSDDDVNALVLATSELVTNSVRAQASEARVTVRLESDAIVLEVNDNGPGFDPTEEPALPDDATAERGRGLYITRSLVDDLSIDRGAHGTRVALRRRITAPAEVSLP